MNLKEKYLKIALMTINEIEQQTSIEVNRLLERAHVGNYQRTSR